MTLPSQSADQVGDIDGTQLRIASSADNWKRRLLDLTKRNRALNFKLTKVSTVAVVDEQPAQIFRQLCLLEKPMQLTSRPIFLAFIRRGNRALPGNDADDR